MEKRTGGIRLADLKVQRRTFTFDFGGHDVTVTYDRMAHTPAFAAEMEAAMKDAQSDLLTKGLARLLIEWDVLGDDDQPLPITPETLSTLPTVFLAEVMAGLGRDMGNPRAPGR